MDDCSDGLAMGWIGCTVPLKVNKTEDVYAKEKRASDRWCTEEGEEGRKECGDLAKQML
jgi:hypothetical protein